MRTHDEESLRGTAVGPSVGRDGASLDASVAGRAVAERRAGMLDAHAMTHLQRVAGNRAVGEMIEDDQSPVLGVVGKGGGSPLDASTRVQMEAAMGENFGDVRVHTGREAAHSAASVQATAYTVGNDVVFGQAFDPGSDAGKRTLAHELTHVVQQRAGAVDGTPQSGGVSVSDPSDRFERAAERNADAVMASAAVTAPAQREVDRGAVGDGFAASLQREAEEEPED